MKVESAPKAFLERDYWGAAWKYQNGSAPSEKGKRKDGGKGKLFIMRSRVGMSCRTTSLDAFISLFLFFSFRLI